MTTKQRIIPIAGPSITQSEIEAVCEAVKNGWYENAGEANKRFERAFADYVDRKYAISLPSCTSAIHLALAAYGITEGDEVIVPDVTWIASSAPVSYVGAQVVFADIDSKTWCISPESFERLITPKTRCVIVVDLYGNLPDMERIEKIAKQYNLLVIEDAAEAVGSSRLGRLAGSFGDVSVFSFHGSKTMTTGEGGMLVTDNKRLYERCQFLADHGRKCGDTRFQNTEVGFKYKMSDMQAALGLAQLERVQELVARKREIFEWYQKELSTCDFIRLNDDSIFNSYWMVTVVWKARERRQKYEVIEALAKKGIASRPFFNCLSQIPAYANTNQAQKAQHENEVAQSITPFGINLPSALAMTKEDVRYVADCFKKIFI